MNSCMIIKIRILFLLSFILYSLPQLAQLPEDEILTKQYCSLQNIYYNSMNRSDEILNGREYKIYFYPQFSSPLIPEKPLPTASVIIKGKRYEKIVLQYDTYKDKLVYFGPDNMIDYKICPIAINQSIVDEFKLQLSTDNLIFRYLEFPEDQNGKLRSGFYEIVYDGGCQFIIKHRSRKTNNGVWDIYHYRPEQYVVNAGVYYRIKGKRSLLTALADKTTEVKRYIKSSTIQVKRAEKNQIENILEYYNSLLLP